MCAKTIFENVKNAMQEAEEMVESNQMMTMST